MRYGPNLLEEVLRRTDIVQLVGRRVKLTRKGRVMWGCCPFHKEKSPSFKVENERRTYKCFGCGAGGDAFKWVMETEGLSFPESVEKLASEAGVELPKWSPEDEAREEKKKSLYDIVELAAAFYEEQLRGPHGSAASEYLKLRGLNNEEDARQFRLGYAPRNNALIEHLKTKNITLDDMIAAGLARPGDENHGPRDFFYDRLMFPIFDARARPIAFGARALSADAKPKYINTGETALFSKGRMLYNFDVARLVALKEGRIILVEGYMDVIAMSRVDLKAVVAPLGTALTEDQLALLWRTAPEPILAFDGDDAGLRAAHRAARLALPHLKPGHSLRFAFLPSGEDPDSFIKVHGKFAMDKLLLDAQPLSRVLWRVETEGKDFSTPERRAGLERSLSEIVSAISDSKIADYYRRDFEQQVFESFKRRLPRRSTEGAKTGAPYSDQRPRKFSQRPDQSRGPEQSVSPAVRNSLLARTGRGGVIRVKELEVASLLLECPSLAATHAELLAALTFTDRSLDRLRHELLNLAASGFGLEKGALENHLVRSGMADLVVRLTARPPSGVEGEAVLGDDIETRWLRAAAQLREIAELGPERDRAMERFKNDGTEENWRDAHRLLDRQTGPARD